MAEYRIWRTDPHNIAIQRRAGKKGQRWVTVSYHGHSLKSLISGLFVLIWRDYTPNEQNLLKSLENIELALVSGMGRIEEMVKEYYEQE